MGINGKHIKNKIAFDDIRKAPTHGFLRGAHHPACPRHENHLLRIGSHPVCLGCTFMYGGMVLGVIVGVYITILTNFTLLQIVLGILLAFLPTAVQPWLQNKLFKMFARTCLGMSVSVLTLILVSGHSLPNPLWFWRLGLIIAFVFMYRFLFWLRQVKPNDPCANCTEGVYPVCEWNLKNVRSSTTDPKLLAALEYQLAAKPEVIFLDKGGQSNENMPTSSANTAERRVKN